ncbi:MAG: hypothetical protein LBT20_03260, partial [Clostridiales bacterium]|nr:hypothetical protein [Clostridiales bacterium]
TDKSYSYVNGVLASYLKRKRNIEISDGSGGAEIAEADIEAEIAETETAEADIEAEIAETETEEIAEAEIAETDIEAEIEG